VACADADRKESEATDHCEIEVQWLAFHLFPGKLAADETASKLDACLLAFMQLFLLLCWLEYMPEQPNITF
jgi:hypothetical protein